MNAQRRELAAEKSFVFHRGHWINAETLLTTVPSEVTRGLPRSK